MGSGAVSEQLRPPVFVLEDSDEDFDTVQEAWRAAGLTNAIHRAKTGDHFLALLRASPTRPALVLLDLNTPGLDGRETLREIKSDPSLHDLPVVVLTTSANPRDLVFCYGVGANAYHVKPVRYADHLAVLRTLLGYWLGSVALPGYDRGAR
jgi:CheY-like chemotaxis protein